MDKFPDIETTSHSYATEEESLSHRMLHTGLLIDKYYTPLLCLLGAFGNSLSLLVFCMDGKYRQQSSSYYLSALAISDSGFLLNLLAVWLESLMGGVITSHLTCPLVMYLGQVTCFVSVYLTVGFSLERYIAVNFPFSKPRICTKSKAKKVIAVVVTLALLVFSYVWFIAKVIEIPIQSSPQICEDNFDEKNPMVNKTDSMKWIEESYFENLENELSPSLFKTKTDNEPRNISCESFSGHHTMKYMCTVPERFYKISEIANYLDSGVTLIIPFLMITFFNINIAISVWRRRSQRKHIIASLALTLNPTIILTTGSSPKITTNNMEQNSSKGIKSSIKTAKTPLNSSQKDGVMLSSSTNRIRNGSFFNSGWKTIPNGNLTFLKQNTSMHNKMNESFSEPLQYKQQQPPPRSEVRVTKTLLLVSTVFLILNLPLHAIRCTQFIQTATGTPEGQVILQALQPWANMLFNTNFAVNILVYCVSGSNFRKSLRNIIARVFKTRKPAAR